MRARMQSRGWKLESTSGAFVGAQCVEKLARLWLSKSREECVVIIQQLADAKLIEAADGGRFEDDFRLYHWTAEAEQYAGHKPGVWKDRSSPPD